MTSHEGMKTKTSLFQALSLWGRSKKQAGDERGLVEKKERSREPVSIVLKYLILVYQLLVYPLIGYF